MQCGKPTFLSRMTCLPEIAGNNAFYFESFDAASMASAYQAGMATSRSDSGFSDRVRTHAASFGWAETARGYLRVYESILGPLPSAPTA
jgi:glycosyltransferase involved in cell wall biosynthesis